MKKKILLIILCIMILFFIQCNSGSTENNGQDNLLNSSQNREGLFSLIFAGTSEKSSMATSNKENVLKLEVILSELKVHRTSDSSAGWIPLQIEESTYDLMVLNTETLSELISLTHIEAGNYNKLRFVISKATVTTESGIYEADIPSGEIKLNVPFIVHEDGKTEITILVNPVASLKKNGNKNNPKYKLSPVLHIGSINED